MQKCVLVVEDSASNRQLLCDIVERVFDCTVIAAESGERAVEMAQESIPDLILMDLKLPGMDGIAAMSLIKGAQATSHIPILALTGYVAGDDESGVRAKGFDGFLPKPFDVPKLLEIVSAHLSPRTDL